MSRKNAVRVVTTLALVVMGSLSAACTSEPPPPPNAQQAAQNTVNNRENYIPQNDVEGKNYNARQRLADDPAALIWCSVYPANPSVKPFTVAIVGKLTSGNKRPYPTSRSLDGGGDGTAGQDFYSPEAPGNDGFFGSSGEYRYGFGPDGNYHDFYNTETYCTTVPTLIQKQTTQIAVTSGGDLSLLDKQAEEALRACRAKDTDPSKPCPEAARLLGVG